MATYRQDIVCTETVHAIHLKFVESMAYRTDEELLAVDKLKGDIVVRIRTTSSSEYDISMKYILGWLKDTETSPEDIANAVYERWYRIHHKD